MATVRVCPAGPDGPDARVIGETAPLLMIGMKAFIVEYPTTPFDPASGPVTVATTTAGPRALFNRARGDHTGAQPRSTRSLARSAGK